MHHLMHTVRLAPIPTTKLQLESTSELDRSMEESCYQQITCPSLQTQQCTKTLRWFILRLSTSALWIRYCIGMILTALV
jgi:hypothetical protein